MRYAVSYKYLGTNIVHIYDDHLTAQTKAMGFAPKSDDLTAYVHELRDIERYTAVVQVAYQYKMENESKASKP